MFSSIHLDNPVGSLRHLVSWSSDFYCSYKDFITGHSTPSIWWESWYPGWNFIDPFMAWLLRTHCTKTMTDRIRSKVSIGSRGRNLFDGYKPFWSDLWDPLAKQLVTSLCLFQLWDFGLVLLVSLVLHNFVAMTLWARNSMLKTWFETFYTLRTSSQWRSP